MVARVLHTTVGMTPTVDMLEYFYVDVCPRIPKRKHVPT
jgi:hypothetical protein